MERSCARALDLGLPAIAFTEHLDQLTSPRFDAPGYLEAIEKCRERFPSLRILSGAAEVVRQYPAEVARLVTESDVFSVLAHIDNPVRSWPEQEVGRFDPWTFEEEFRHALRVTAQSGRALEINTRIPLQSTVLSWWYERRWCSGDLRK